MPRFPNHLNCRRRIVLLDKLSGDQKGFERMLGKLGAHSMFAGPGALRRLQMCADCRVVDMMENKAEATIHDFKR